MENFEEARKDVQGISQENSNILSKTAKFPGYSETFPRSLEKFPETAMNLPDI